MTSDRPADAGRAGSSAIWRVVSWAIWLLVAAIAAATLLSFPPISTTRRDLVAYADYILVAMWGVAFAALGALIVANRRSNRIGWLLIWLGAVWSVTGYLSGYSQARQAAAEAARLLSGVGYLAWVASFLLLVLLFPDGRPLSPRWRPVVWFAALWPPSLLLIGLAFAPEDFFSENPGGPLQVALVVLIVVTFIAALVSAFIRFSRSSGVERQQLKWFAYATAVGAAGAVIGSLLRPWGSLLVGAGYYAPLAGIAVALFRHRLYDIDVLINRTFVYGSLVAILAGLYAASIQLFKVVFVALTGDESDAAIVITTLILATTFTPIKNRLEEIAKRRFKDPDETAPADESTPATIEALRAELHEQARRLEQLEHEVRARG